MIDRGAVSRPLWQALWLLWFVYAFQQVIDVARFDAPWPVWLIRVLPLVIFMPSVARGSLRAVIWLCFVLLFYFISAVELIFAKPHDTVAIVGICAVVALFSVATLYIRFRGKELKAGPAEQKASEVE